MTEDLRWRTKAGIEEEGTVREDILDYFQESTRQRGYPPFLLEIALEFSLDKPAAIKERNLIVQHLARVTYEVERPKQDPHLQLIPQVLPQASGTFDPKAFTGRDCWPDSRDRMIYWHTAAENGYLPGTVDFVLHEEQIALTPQSEPYLYSLDSVCVPKYEEGSRPFLENVLAETTEGCGNNRSKALALVQLIGNPDSSPYRDPRYTEMFGEKATKPHVNLNPS